MLCQVDYDIAKMVIIKGYDTGNRYSDNKVLYRDKNTFSGVSGFILSEDYDNFEEFTGEVLIWFIME